MAKTKLNPSALLSPLPAVMVSCARGDETPDIVTVAWTGILSSKPPVMYISLRPERYSHGIITESGEFCVNLTNEKLVRATDLCGMKTGKKTDKFKETGLTPEYAEGFACPGIAESPLSVFCRVTEIKKLGSHDMFVANVVSVYADEALFGANGKLRLEKAGLISYSHGEYFAQGRRLGSFGYSVAPKRKPAARKK